MKLFFFGILFMFTSKSPGQTNPAIKKCDTLQFKISGNNAVAIAKKDNYKHCHFNQLEVHVENDSCQWHVVLKDTYTVVHHGYYSDTFYEYFIDTATGIIVKRNGHKVLGGKAKRGD